MTKGWRSDKILEVRFQESMIEDLKEAFEICRADAEVLFSEEGSLLAGMKDFLELREEESVGFLSGEVKLNLTLHLFCYKKLH